MSLNRKKMVKEGILEDQECRRAESKTSGEYHTPGHAFDSSPTEMCYPTRCSAQGHSNPWLTQGGQHPGDARDTAAPGDLRRDADEARALFREDKDDLQVTKLP